MPLPIALAWGELGASVVAVMIAARRWRTLDPRWRLVAGFFAFVVLAYALVLFWVNFVDRTNNLATGYIIAAVEAPIVLWLLADLQRHRVVRDAVRIAIPVFWAVLALALVLVEDLRSYSILVQPLLGILVLAAGVIGIATEALDEAPADPRRREALLLLSVLTLRYGASTLLSIGQAYFQRLGDAPGMIRVLLVRNSLSLTTLVLLTGLFLWATRPTSSGRSSSPAPSR